MNDEEILDLCCRLGGTVYETIRIAKPTSLIVLMKLVNELLAPSNLIKRARPILKELSADPDRHNRLYQSYGNLNKGQFLEEVVIAVKYIYNGSGSGKMTNKEKKFIREAEAVIKRFPF